MNEVISLTQQKNNLFPVFLKLEELKVLLIGGGNVALEKLNAILNNSPKAKVKVISKEISHAFYERANAHANIEIIIKEYQPSFLNDCDIVIAAVNDIALSKRVFDDAHKVGKLINVADKPALCDFYLTANVTKGNLKLAISTNGKSPTIAKRLKEVFNDTLPNELDEVLENIEEIRKNLNGDFKQKVYKLNEITKTLVVDKSEKEKYEAYWFL